MGNAGVANVSFEVSAEILTDVEAVRFVGANGEGSVRTEGNVLENVAEGDVVRSVRAGAATDGGGSLNEEVGQTNESGGVKGVTLGAVRRLGQANAVVGETGRSSALGRGSGSKGRDGEDREDMLHSVASIATV